MTTPKAISSTCGKVSFSVAQRCICGCHPLPDRAALVATLRRFGIDDDTHVVAYDAHGGMFAARLWWLLRWLGHEAVAVLDGGLPAWQATGLELPWRT